MKSRWFLVLFVLAIWLYTGYGASIGQDACNYCQPTIIRTHKISVPTPDFRVVCTKTPGPQQYTPISSPCSCVNTQVTPAPITRVDCDLTATTPSPAVGTCGGGVGASADPPPFGEPGGAFFPGSTCDDAATGFPVSQDPPGPTGIDEPAATGNGCCGDGGGGGPPAVAVDPVSLMLAQAEANRCRGDVREDRLAFGPVAVPKDAVPASPAAPDVNEEGLYALDKAIVELKTCKRYGQTQAAQASDTDARLALEEDAQEEADAAAAGPEVTLPSYADVGYRTETPSCAPLIGGVPVPAATRPKPIVVCDATVTVPPVTDMNDYSPRYCCGCSKTSPQWQCTCGKSAGGVCSCGMCSAGVCSCGKSSGGMCSY